MQDERSFSLDLKIALAVFVAVFVVYLLTLCPGIYAGPSAKAVCDVEGVGLIPPISHPVWLILGRFFSLFSSNTAYMLNLMSALFGALTIGLLYLLLSQFTHSRTAEEEARYQVQPYLPRVTALSGALLVAFSHPFWEGSVLAGSDTLNTFFLVLVVFLVWSYAKTSKARYAMLLGLIYGIALGNYPTLLLLAPIFVVFLLVRGRGLLDDPVAFVATFLLFLLGLLPAIYAMPRAYYLQGKDYVAHANSFGPAISVFFDSYFRSMKGLFLQKGTLHAWIFWLFAPTFVPILFFMMKRGEYEKGSDTATRFTYLIRYAFVALFTVGALGYLWGFLIGPVGMAELDFLRYSRYLGSYVVVGAWFSYILGYWMIVTSGRFEATGTEPVPKIKYRKVIYIVSVVLALGLPVAGIVMCYGKSTKRGAYYVEDFAKGILQSSPEEAIIIVPVDPFFESIGAPLRYIQSQREAAAAGGGKTIIDLNAAYIDFVYEKYRHRTKRIKTAQYLAETLLGREVVRPRIMFLPEDPFPDVYDRIVWWETVRARDAGQRPRPICGLVNNFFVSDLRGENDLMNIEFTAEPSGLVYIYRDKREYRDKSETIDDNQKVWSKLKLRTRADKEAKRSEVVEEYVLGEYSKSANDFGLFCQLAGRLDLAEHYYRRALEWLPENSSALWNLASVMDSKGEKNEAKELKEKSTLLMKKQQEMVADIVRRYGFALDVQWLSAFSQYMAQSEGTQPDARRLGILRVVSRMQPDNPFMREQIGDFFFSSQTIEETFLSYERGSPLRQASAEYLAALETISPENQEAARWFLRKLGRVYAKWDRNAKAEEFFRRALDEENPSSLIDLMRLYLTTDQKPDEVKELAGRIIEKVPADDQEKKRLAGAKWIATAILVNVLLQENETERAKESVREYLRDYPEDADKLVTLAREFLLDARFDSFTIWLFDEYANLGKELLMPRLLQLAEVYFRQEQYEDIIAMEQPAQGGLGMQLAQFHHWMAMAYEELGRNEEAEKAFERARTFLPEDSGGFGTVLLNNLAWRYFKNRKLGEAQKLAEDALRRDPANSLVWDTCGWVSYKAGEDPQRALDLIERSHLANPESGIIAYHYGKLLMEEGQTEKGMFVLGMAVKVGIEGKEELEDAQGILKSREAGAGGIESNNP